MEFRVIFDEEEMDTYGPSRLFYAIVDLLGNEQWSQYSTTVIGDYGMTMED